MIKRTPSTRHILRYPVTGLILALVLTLILATCMHLREKSMLAILQNQQQMLRQAQQQHSASNLEQATLGKYLSAYQQLITRGFVGEEKRSLWMDSLRHIQRQHNLLPVEYSIGVQEHYPATFAKDTPDFKLYRSVMKFGFPMLHEGDLLTLMHGLDQASLSPSMLRDCIIVRLTSDQGNVTSPALKASCELDWLTWRTAKAS